MSTPIIKFRTGGCIPIEPVRIERETAACVWINGRKNRKLNGDICYFDTFDEAKAKCIERAERNLDRARFNLESAQRGLINSTARLQKAKELSFA